MLDFLEKYRVRGAFGGVCSSYMQRLLKCGSRRMLVDMMLTAQGVEFMATVTAKGLITPTELLADLSPFANGKYVFDNGYTSAFYVGLDVVDVNTTILLLVGCKCVRTKKNGICELYIVGDTKIEGDGKAKVHVYYPDGTSLSYIYAGI